MRLILETWRYLIRHVWPLPAVETLTVFIQHIVICCIYDVVSYETQSFKTNILGREKHYSDVISLYGHNKAKVKNKLYIWRNQISPFLGYQLQRHGIPCICYERSFNGFYLYMEPISFQSKASVVCSVSTAVFIDFCLKKLNVFSQHIG